jgi:hypothetical protein
MSAKGGKNLFLILSVFSLLSLSLSLGNITFAGTTDNLDCTNRGGTCYGTTQTDKDCSNSSGCNSGSLEGITQFCCKPSSGTSTDCTNCKTACSATEDTDISKTCTGANTGKTCCKPKPTTGGDTGTECSCQATTECPDANDQIASKNAACGTGKLCCKPKCTNCKADCTGTFEIDSSKSTKDCPVVGEKKQVCCKTQSADNGGGGGGKTPGASYDLAQYAPITADIPTLIGQIIKGALGIVGSVALLTFVYGGFLMLISQGDAAKIKKGKDALVWATLGLVVIFGSYILLSYIISALVSGGTGGGEPQKVPCPAEYSTCKAIGSQGYECVSAPSNSSCSESCCRPTE